MNYETDSNEIALWLLKLSPHRLMASLTLTAAWLFAYKGDLADKDVNEFHRNTSSARTSRPSLWASRQRVDGESKDRVIRKLTVERFRKPAARQLPGAGF
jgi:hypothetical protein